MTVSYFVHSLGSIGVFPSRAFLPAFVTALLLRFGDSIPLVAHAGLSSNIEAPPWFVCNASLIILGLLSCLECWATKNSDVRQILDQFDGWVKPGMAFLTTLGVVSVRDAEIVREIQQAGLADGLSGVMAAGAVYFFTSARRSLYDLLTDMDPHDSLGLQRLFSWTEETWVVLGAVVLFVFPIVMVLLTATVFGLLYLWQKSVERWEESHRIACDFCGGAIYHCAAACPACGAPNGQACSVSWLGQPKADRPADPAHHALHLIAVGRCPSCATRLRQRRPRQACECCGGDALADDAQLDAYLRLVQARLPRTLLICFGLGLVPIVGVVPAIVFYRFQLVNPLRRYVPFGSALLAKWLARFACLVVLSVQWIPLVGGASLPIMASINHAIYRRALQAAWRRQRSQPLARALTNKANTRRDAIRS